MGPIALFDKSFLQSLSVDEAVWFDHFFYTIVCPLFFVETLADLKKTVRTSRTPEQEVKIIADKFPELNGNPCAYHLDLCLINLLGKHVPMRQQIPQMRGKPVKSGGKTGIVYELSPESQAFSLWSQGKFSDVEYNYAQIWRDQLSSLDLNGIADCMRSLGGSWTACKTLNDAKRLADSIVTSREKPHDLMMLACLLLRIPRNYHPKIFECWKDRNYQPLENFAPYASFVVTVELFFRIALGAHLISADRVSNYVDISYICYLPFCQLFVSADKLHQRCASLFLRENKQFIWGNDLKNGLNKLNSHYNDLPSETKEKGITFFAKTPPTKGSFLVSEIWDAHLREWRKKSEIDYVEKANELYPKLGEEISKIAEAPSLKPEDVDFNTSDPDTVTVKRSIRKRKGSWYQLPKKISK